MKNRILYVILSVPFVAFGVCGYILLRWGNASAFGVVLGFDVPIVLGAFLRFRSDSKSWRQGSTPIPRADPLYPRTNDLAMKIGVPQHDLYVSDPMFMAKRRAVGAATKGIRRHLIIFSEYFLKALTQEEQDAIIAHELAHTKQSHGFIQVLASISFFFAGWNLFLFSAIPNLQTSNLPDFWINGIASAGLILFIVGLIAVRPYLSAKGQIEADEIAVNTLGSGDSLISGMKKLVESPEIKGDQKKYRLARQGLYDRMVRIQTLSRSLAARKLSQHNTV